MDYRKLQSAKRLGKRIKVMRFALKEWDRQQREEGRTVYGIILGNQHDGRSYTRKELEEHLHYCKERLRTMMIMGKQ